MLFIFAYEAAGAASTRHSLRPLFSEGHDLVQSGHDVLRECGGVAD
jgi:hypothetical protein